MELLSWALVVLGQSWSTAAESRLVGKKPQLAVACRKHPSMLQVWGKPRIAAGPGKQEIALWDASKPSVGSQQPEYL